ncbi:hypothetical protein OGAPHI_004620 [Ogataea philodendri]|uniref:Uncharacterized protein n=1 Tax=Ogataea philodendri TaxID=1378263 RepID=A0A9P8P1V4_9ASCO|nr:uncharacterized protein OGAPHI_004620 [Ogataea philodendri]KAH3664268.1 hypothetical protein OGAPHI_004620 [Ogataea philodendri]
MVDLVSWLQSSQNSNGLSDGRFTNVDALEPSFKSTVFLDVLTVLGHSGGTNAVEVTSGQSWLQQVGSVRLSVTHQHVDLINEEDDHGLGILDVG